MSCAFELRPVAPSQALQGNKKLEAALKQQKQALADAHKEAEQEKALLTSQVPPEGLKQLPSSPAFLVLPSSIFSPPLSVSSSAFLAFCCHPHLVLDPLSSCFDFGRMVPVCPFSRCPSHASKPPRHFTEIEADTLTET